MTFAEQVRPHLLCPDARFTPGERRPRRPVPHPSTGEGDYEVVEGALKPYADWRQVG